MLVSKTHARAAGWLSALLLAGASAALAQPCSFSVADVELTGDLPSALAVAETSAGTYVYSANAGAGEVGGFRIDPVSGVLTPVGARSTGSQPVALDVAGDFLVAAEANDTVGSFRIDPVSGVLTPVGSTGSGGSGPTDVAGTDGGLLVVSHDSGEVGSFRIDPVSGVLTPVGSALAGDRPAGVDVVLDEVVVVANADSGDLTTFRLDLVSGSLTLLEPSIPAGFAPFSVVAAGNRAHVASAGSVPGEVRIHSFRVNRHSGALSPAGDRPGGEQLSDMALGPAGRSLFVATTDGVEDKFAVFALPRVRSRCATDIAGRFDPNKAVAAAAGSGRDFLVYSEPSNDLLIVLAVD